MVLSLGFNAGYQRGWRYFLYNTVTNELDYFARVATDLELNTTWSASGEYFYYSLPGTSEWYVFEPATYQHRIIGTLPPGHWTRDGQSRYRWYTPHENEVVERRENDQPIPHLRIWDSQTGITHQYCIPNTENTFLDEIQPIFSPDGRYMAFIIFLDGDVVDDLPRARTLILDLETGKLTELSRDLSRLIVWTE